MTPGVMEGLAVTACILLLIAAGFQAALAAGAPWGAMAYGGRVATADGRLGPRHRIAGAATAVVLVVVGAVLLLRAGLLGAPAGAVPAAVCWVLAALFALNTVGNLAARHPVERWGMGSVTACLTVLCALLALG